jgi:3-methyladenine DNA glycosylase/8-oxoguanine DNA glycosylase
MMPKKKNGSATAIAALTEADPVLGKHIARIGAFTLETTATTSVYEALARSIVFQQLTGKAASTIFGRVEALGGASFPTPDALLQLDDDTLRGAGLSRAKVAAMRDLALRTKNGELPTIDEVDDLDDDVLIEKLTTVRGIGVWTVQMLLIFRLGRPDVLPSTDYGVQKGFQKVFRKAALPKPADIVKRAERWRPNRSMASWYLWRALDPKPDA